ncbi:hypothetical protein [Stutzerimonas stutzeri]|uniref:Uncharacterized protein n=1 Tax=Stutzerimonas stutzeri KOS6 TaxID=1218352 RepID=A0A061JLV9_STUST|nr:hypothetical protein [Stutzerimonas stutzeri]EWC39593.1 hypothetical protein B597_019575 [Stutzerimonas stutzeri KOS6]
MKFEIDLDEYLLSVEVTHCAVVEPDYRCRDSADDYYGYREMEFEVISGSVFDEDGNETELGRNGCAGVAEQYAEDIEDRLWTLIEKKREAA